MRMAAVADNEDLRLEGISIGVGLRVAPGIAKAEAERFIKETAEAFCRGRRLAGVGLAWLLWLPLTRLVPSLGEEATLFTEDCGFH